jgi:hypothetical protein
LKWHNFEKKNNARVVQLTGKLTSMKLGEKQSIAEYIGEFREIKVDLEAAGQSVAELQLAVHAVKGPLPKEYDTLREILEAGQMELSLDTVQPKLMQREQTLKLQAESKTPQVDSGDEEQCNGRTRYRCSSANHVRKPWLSHSAHLTGLLVRALLCKNCVALSKTNVL